MRDAVLAARAERAKERQLDYMRAIASEWAGDEKSINEGMIQRSKRVRSALERYQSIHPDDHVLEVGSGATGLIFNFGTSNCIGVDPLADHQRELFPWQRKSSVPTLAVEGENLPFPDNKFDVVISENVVDHARNPKKIVSEMVRVLKPGGLVYFSVNIHHPLYHLASCAYGAWRAMGLPGELQPFADHTVHLNPARARRLFDGLAISVLEESENIEETKRKAAETDPRHVGDRLKRLFYKNAVYKLIARKM